ncbi:MAG: prepilin-type N-terminal cleavage/methylation domain-containing protein, partial [Planctomycetes bacterium]|nr:prepilin-type N-terminal cleavage/methylation domain-containing protein [Planctomycetota bacterium]
MTVKRPKTACGFTLVEVLIAIVILTVVAIGGVAFIYHSQVGLIFQGDK